MVAIVLFLVIRSLGYTGAQPPSEVLSKRTAAKINQSIVKLNGCSATLIRTSGLIPNDVMCFSTATHCFHKSTVDIHVENEDGNFGIFDENKKFEEFRKIERNKKGISDFLKKLQDEQRKTPTNSIVLSDGEYGISDKSPICKDRDLSGMAVTIDDRMAILCIRKSVYNKKALSTSKSTVRKSRFHKKKPIRLCPDFENDHERKEFEKLHTIFAVGNSPSGKNPYFFHQMQAREVTKLEIMDDDVNPERRAEVTLKNSSICRGDSGGPIIYVGKSGSICFHGAASWSKLAYAGAACSNSKRANFMIPKNNQVQERIRKAYQSLENGSICGTSDSKKDKRKRTFNPK